MAGSFVEDSRRKLHEDKQLEKSIKQSSEVLITTWSCRRIEKLLMMTKAPAKELQAEKLPRCTGGVGDVQTPQGMMGNNDHL